ncbi:glycosyltransferase family 2 protein [Mucilaginibacter sp. RS28]|uniref:Glycosyltransferase family 2 protein n=1 Tax=Mucilaginibacter straminoryzae TaxID=2932774 RepID=A0A9X1X708_9SPHI|nr:glycosyltransferase family 2 protein [Mucilaginibacter straminoryzae]MCJ8209794.1 glycosyltransferase family 2 protein [Mucilaginibacter straminoryzae]
MPKAVAVILVNYNTPDYTINCVNSLKQYCNTSLFDVIVLDNGSADDSLNILRTALPSDRIIANGQNLGFAEGNNVGLRISIDEGYTYSLVINTDTLTNEDVVSGLYSYLQENITVAAVQPAIYWMHDRANIWNGPCYFNKFTGKVYSKTQVETAIKTVDWATGCCVMYRNSALAKSGLFNKRFFLYYEDTELSLRLGENGFGIYYLPQYKIYHEAGVSGKTKTKQKEGYLWPVIHYYTTRNRIWILRLYGSAVFTPIYLLYHGGYILGLLGYLTMRGRFAKVRQVIKGIKEGLFTSKAIIMAGANDKADDLAQ